MSETEKAEPRALEKQTKGIEGRPNGRTDRMRKLKAMTSVQRKAHRATWRAAAKVVRVPKPVAAATTPVGKGKQQGKR